MSVSGPPRRASPFSALGDRAWVGRLPCGADVRALFALVTDHAQLIDHERFRHAVHAKINADATAFVEDRCCVGIAKLLQPVQRRFALVFVVQAIDRHHAGLGKFHQHRMLVAARHTPRRPHIQNPHLAKQLFRTDHLRRLVQLR